MSARKAKGEFVVSTLDGIEAALAALDDLRGEIAALRMLVAGQDALLVAYRTGRVPSEATFAKKTSGWGGLAEEARIEAKILRDEIAMPHTPAPAAKGAGGS